MPEVLRGETHHRPVLTAIGGGSGLSVLLRGLKHRYTRGALEELTAIVTMADDGGSSGRLRRELGALPPGDIRNCLVALADDEDLLARLFQYRFTNGHGLSGHSFGNLLLTALADITGDFSQAVLTAEKILSVRGKILPATLEDVRLRGIGRSGKVYDGESQIGRSAEPLSSLRLEPADVPAFPAAVDALRRADLIVIGPGSLYTSLIPNLLIPGIRRAVRDSHGRVVLVINLMTQPGETDHMDGLAHLRAFEEHVEGDLIDTVLVNSRPPDPEVMARYREAGSELVEIDGEALAARGVGVVRRDLLATGELIRHDPAKLSLAALELARCGRLSPLLL